MSPLFAFLHHLTAFTLFATLVVEFVLLKDDLTLQTARKLQVVDLVYGISAGLILVIGGLRVIYFEKGLDYYLHSTPFLLKMTLFLIVGLLSVYPTIEFFSWRKSLSQGQTPVISAAKLRTIRLILHLELVGLVLILLFAALMAKGVG